MRILYILLFLNLIPLSYIHAQSPQGWLIYFGNTQIKDSKFSIHHEIQLRDYKLIGDHNQSLVRIGGQYQIKPYLQATLGYSFIHSESQGDPNNPFNEHRIYQEALISHGIKAFKIRHRFRLEERFVENQDFRGRLRYCLFGDLPLTTKGFDKNGIYLAAYNEIFLNISDNNQITLFDRNRSYFGLGYKVHNNLGLQFGYMRQHVGKNAGTNHLLLSFHHKIQWK